VVCESRTYNSFSTKSVVACQSIAAMVIYVPMNRAELSKYFASIGSKGGIARAKALTKKEQRAIALKASKAAAKARKTVGKP